MDAPNCVLLEILSSESATSQRLEQPRALAFLCGFKPSALSRQLLPHNRYIVRRIRTNPHLLAFHAQHRDLDPFTGGQFNDESFAWAAGEDEHGGLLAIVKNRVEFLPLAYLLLTLNIDWILLNL
jgi:hypothetical protein